MIRPTLLLSAVSPLTAVQASEVASVAAEVAGAEAPLPAETTSVLPPPANSRLINEGIQRLYALAEGRDRFWGPQIQRLREKVAYLMRHDRDSLKFLDGVALHVSDPNSKEAGDLIWLVHKTHARLATWPASVKRRGPVAALYYFHGPKSRKAARLKDLLKDERTESITFQEKSGDFQAVIRLPERRIQMAKLFPPNPLIADEDRRLLIRLLQSLKQREIAETRDDLNAIVDRVMVLRQEDEPSYRAFLAAVDAAFDSKKGISFEQWVPLRKALASASKFARRWRSRIVWAGTSFTYFHALAESGTPGAALFNRLSKGNVRSVSFEGGSFELGRHIAQRRTTLMQEAAYTYGRRSSFSSLPNPENGWGESDFAKTEETLRREVRGFFAAQEKKLGLTAAQIQRTLRIPYYFLRDGRTAMTGAQLSDSVLDRLELSEAKKEWLRHTQTLLILERDRASGPERGPYWREGLLIRYFRLLHQIKLQDVQAVYRTGFEIEGPTEVELGRVMIDDRTKLEAVAQAIKVPKSFRAEFVDHLLVSYARTRGTLPREAAGNFDEFPNAVFALPYAGLRRDALLERFKAFGRGLRSPLTRVELEKETGLTSSQVHNFETNGDLAFSAVAAYEAFLKSRAREDDALRLRSMRAALDIRYHPIPDRGGYFPAGRLLRFTRAIMGLTIAQTVAALEIDVPAPAYTRWEWGFVAMPNQTVIRYADLLVHKGVLSASEFFGFMSEMARIYGNDEGAALGRS